MKTMKEIQKELGGRPKSEKKKIRVSTYLDPNQLKLLQTLASSNSESLSHYLRRILIEKV